ncbi:MAG TPA: DPP IV N-terminal domain-containing protein, partial [Rubrivivax sp.]|nr:DPP IV N-terminal domain-containing protein [Rubrivivax sp.]
CFVPLAMAPLVSNYAPIVPATADPRLAERLPADIGIVHWSGSQLVVVHEQRGWQSVRVLVIDPATRSVREVLHETAATHVQLAAQRYPAQLALLSDGSLVFYSERSGWGHLWLKPVAGEPRPLTSGPWTVRELHRVDEASGQVFFSASGRESDVDPYHRLLYRVPLQGGEPCRMTLHNADHDIHQDKARRTWVATWSRVDHPGGRVELDDDGHVIYETPAAVPAGQALERAFAKRFCVTAADGITPLYGVLHLPQHRTPGARLPLLDHVYGAPQRTQAQVRYSLSASVRPDDTQALTSLGFAVFVLDGRGTPMRGKAFHDCSWGAGHADACGLGDHAAAVQQIASSSTASTSPASGSSARQAGATQRHAR